MVNLLLFLLMSRFRALAFKIMDDRFGALTFVRIYSGRLNKGDTILNSFTGKLNVLAVW